MRGTLITFIGIILICVGIFTVAYQGFTYNKEEKVAQIGNVQITAENEKRVYFPPALGGLSFVAGIILVFVGRNFK